MHVNDREDFVALLFVFITSKQFYEAEMSALKGLLGP